MCRSEKLSLTLWNTEDSEDDVNINETVAQVLAVDKLTPRLPEVSHYGVLLVQLAQCYMVLGSCLRSMQKETGLSLRN